MSRYTVGIEAHSGERLYVLRDSQSGAYARIWPAFGNNCLAATLVTASGRTVDAILEPSDLDQVRQQPSWWGIPLLFPWPGRIPRGAYEFQGQRYQLPVMDMNGNAGHGFVKNRPWRVEDTEGRDDCASLHCSFSSADHPETLDGYPFPYRVVTTYRLDEGGLLLHTLVSNEGDGPMPFGFGPHPYFRIPIGGDTKREECLVTVPAARRWNLRRVGALAPDERLTWADVTEPVAGTHDLRQPRPLGDSNYDGGFTDLEARDGWIECSVADPRAGLELVMQATANFGTVVVYTPPGRPGICFEPWTCPPNAFNLAARGVEPSGLIVLAPGQEWSGVMRVSLRPLES
ncbi:MAG: aldose 1-epimerase [Chloroflexota bacterium]